MSILLSGMIFFSRRISTTNIYLTNRPVVNEVSNSNYEEILARRDKGPTSPKPPARTDSDENVAFPPERDPITRDDSLFGPHVQSPRDRPWASSPNLTYHDDDPSETSSDEDDEGIGASTSINRRNILRWKEGVKSRSRRS